MDTLSSSIDSAHESAEQLKMLMTLWRQTYPHRATGGFWALYGFSFQSSVYLMRFFQALDTAGTNPMELAEMEKLSDILCPDGDRYLLIQCKTTLTRRRLTEAMHEAYLITQLCRKNSPDLLARLRFQVACRSLPIHLEPSDIRPDEVVGESPDEQIWAEMLAGFHPTEPVIQHDDPIQQLYLYLWNRGVADPVALVSECHGKLLESYGTQDAQQVAFQLINCYQKTQRRDKWKPFGLVVTKEDVERTADADLSQEVLVNAPPRLDHIRRGCLRDRPTVFGPLYQAFRRWLSDLETGKFAGRVPVFWISGRSGEGKSALLLQLLAHWIQSPSYAPIILLNSSDDIPKLLDNPPDTKCFVFVDDLYDVTNPGAWEQAVEKAVKVAIPDVAIVTCGPSEQMEDCISNMSVELDIRNHEIPFLTHTECEQFRLWYEQRTGETRDADTITVKNTLPVLLMFELARGIPISQFARNFQRRLQRLHIFDDVRRIVAVNALYMDAPYVLLRSPESRDALKLLCSKSQMHFRFDDPEHPSGIRLAHAHLAWLLFCEWKDRRASLGDAWARVLTDVMEVLEQNEHMSEMLGEVIHKCLLTKHAGMEPSSEAASPVAERIDLLRELYECHVERNGGRPRIDMIPRWLQASWKLPHLCLKPDPLEYALLVIKDTGTDGGVHTSIALWIWLLSTRLDTKKSESYRRRVYRFLFASPYDSTTAHTWAGILRLSECTSREVQLAYAWVCRSPRSPHVSKVIAALLLRSDCNTHIKHVAMDWINEYPEHAGAGFVLEALIYRCPGDSEVLDLVRDWLAKQAEHEGAPSVLKTIADNSQEDTCELSVMQTWLESPYSDKAGAEVLKAYITRYSNSHALLSMAKRWLQAQPEHPGAPEVLKSLISKYPDSEEIHSLAEEWFQSQPEHPNAHEVIRSLLARAQPSIMMRSAGRWLQAQPEHPGAPEVLKSLISKYPDSEEIHSLAEEWLQSQPEHPGIHEVLKSLALSRHTHAFGLAMAKKWLKCHPTDSRVPAVLGVLVWELRRDKETLDAALFWLNTHPRDRQVPRVLELLVRALPHDADLVARAKAWLEGRLSRPGAPELLQALLFASPLDTSLLSMARAWPVNRPHDTRVSEVIKTLVIALPEDEEVVADAISWLGIQPDHAGAPEVLKTLISKRRDNNDVLPATLSWLEAQPNHRAVNEVLKALVKSYPDDECVSLSVSTWYDRVGDGTAKAEVLRTLIANSEIGSRWYKAGEEYAADPQNRHRVSIIATLLSAESGPVSLIELALDCVRQEPDEGRKSFVLNALGRFLVRHPQKAVSYFAGGSGRLDKELLCAQMAQAMSKNPSTIPGVVQVLPLLEKWAAESIMLHAAQRGVDLSDMDYAVEERAGDDPC